MLACFSNLHQWVAIRELVLPKAFRDRIEKGRMIRQDFVYGCRSMAKLNWNFEGTKRRKIAPGSKQEKPVSEEKQDEKKLESHSEQLKWLCEQDAN